MFELSYEITGVDSKNFYGVNNQYFNLLKSQFPTLKITGREVAGRWLLQGQVEEKVVGRS